MKLLTSLALALSFVQAQAYAADEIEKISLSSDSLANFHMMTESDRSTVCWMIENSCYQKIKSFPKLSLGSRPSSTRAFTSGSSEPANDSDLIKAVLRNLYHDAYATLQDYPDLTIENFAIDKNEKFVVQVDFRQTRNGALQSMAVFGEIRSQGNNAVMVNVTSYSDLNQQQEMNRRALKDLEVILNNPNFVAPAVQVKWQDFTRAHAIGAVVAAWVSAMRILPELPTTVSSADIR